MAKTGTNGIEINAYNGDITANGTIRINRNGELKQVPDYVVFNDSDMVLGKGAFNSYESIIKGQAGNQNTAYGNQASPILVDGAQFNTIIGSTAGHKYTTGNGNTSVGAYCGPYFPTENTGSENTYVGISSALSSTTGSFNAGFGARVLFDLTTGSGNLAIGYGSLPNVTTGDNNLGMGRLSGREIVAGSSNTFVGYQQGDGLGDTSNTLSIGAGSRADIFADSNGIVLGDGNLSTEVLRLVVSDAANLDFADDAEAATGGVPLNGLYHTAGAVKIRLS